MNCQRNFPWYKDWHKSFSSDAFTVVGIHTPELAREEGRENVRHDAETQELEFPIVVDDDKANWNTWGNSMWPSVYLIDKQGYVRYWWQGELNWQGSDAHETFKRRIRELIAEPG